jgi:hypothetical protein
VDRFCISQTSFADLFEASLKFREMRSSPVNLPTAGATAEFLVVDFCKRLEPLNYVGFNDSLERPIAAKATRERSDRIEKMKATDNLDRLVVCVLRARAIAVPDNRMHQQMAIAREQGAIFAFHHAQ